MLLQAVRKGAEIRGSGGTWAEFTGGKGAAGIEGSEVIERHRPSTTQDSRKQCFLR